MPFSSYIYIQLPLVSTLDILCPLERRDRDNSIASVMWLMAILFKGLTAISVKIAKFVLDFFKVFSNESCNSKGFIGIRHN